MTETMAYDGIPTVDNWMRGPGDAVEVKRMVDRYKFEFETPDEAVEQAKMLLRDVAASPEHDEETDAAMNTARLLLWISASMGSRKGAELLASEVRAYARVAVVPRATRIMYSVYAEKYDILAGNKEKPSGLAALRAGRHMEVDDDVHEEQEPAASDGVVVIRQIGDPASNDGKDINRRFGNLVGRRLPSRASMPETNVIGDAISSEWPWAPLVAREIEATLRLQRSVSGKPVIGPLLFVGPPGTGKTALARKIASLIGVPSVVVQAGGASDAAGLAAVTRGWNTSRPCGPVLAAAQHRCCDPAIIVDEVDKTVGPNGRNGSATGVLLGMLGDPANFTDSALLSEVDLSRMTFMATANDLTAVPKPLRDRFTVLMVGRPKPAHFDIVLASMRRKKAADLDVHEAFLPTLDGEEYRVLRDWFVDCGSLREFSRAYDFILSEAVQRVDSTAPQMMS